MGARAAKEARAPPELVEAFARNGCTVDRVVTTPGGGLAALACTRARVYEGAAADTARQILAGAGVHKQVVYVRGTPYEMGLALGRLVPEQVEAVCTTYLNHITPQYLSADMDAAMAAAPLLYKFAYEFILASVTDALTEGAVRAFWATHARGDVPAWYLDELRGLVDGAAEYSSAVTLDRLIAANCGVDYMLMLTLSGRLIEFVRREWMRLPDDFRARVPFRDEFVAAPDMCSVFMASGAATASGRDAFMARDFQFPTAHVFHTYGTLMVRAPQGRAAHIDVSMPGLVGGVTCLGARGLAVGVNMVRAGAADTDRVGLGALGTLRELAETCATVADVEAVLRARHHGVSWIYYALDGAGEARVFEVVPPMDGVAFRAERVAYAVPRVPEDPNGVYARTGTNPRGYTDATALQWSVPLLRSTGHADLADPRRWRPDGRLFDSWQQERVALQSLSNAYFPPWRATPGIVVATNMFLTPAARVYQMDRVSSIVERTAWGNQWRYDSLVAEGRAHWGHIDFERCREIITFLSPWKQPAYPQNQQFRTSHAVLGAFGVPGREYAPPAGDVMISGALSVIDVRALRIENRTGYWGSDPYALCLRDFLERAA